MEPAFGWRRGLILALGMVLIVATGVWWFSEPTPPPAEPAQGQVLPRTEVAAVAWQPYWQAPQDLEPTIVHLDCPTGLATQGPWRIQPGERFRLRPSDCPAYKGQEVVQVQFESNGMLVEGYAVRFASFQPGTGSAGAAPTPGAALALPVMIDYRNYDPSFGPAIVYAWYSEASIPQQGEAGLEQQLRQMAELPGASVTKMLMISSVARLEWLLQEKRSLLQQSGVTLIGYNTERAVGTPEREMSALGDDTAENPIARAAALAEQAGLGLLWGPIRQTIDAVPERALEQMIAAGLDGVALQEQKGIERQSASQRVTAVKQSVARYRQLGGPQFHISVQIMPSRCPASAGGRWEPCVDFVTQLDGTIDSVAIWASAPTDRTALPDLVAALRPRGGQ